MIFKRLFTRRIKTPPLPNDQDELFQIARRDEDSARRLEACRRLQRLPDLRELALKNLEDVDAGVCEIAVTSYLSLLCGQDESGPPLAACLAEVAAIDDQDIIEQLAANAGQPEIRKASFSRLDSAAHIAACALNDPLSTNRCAAVELLTDKEALEQVAKKIGKRDKNVYRIARRKLKEIAEREALPARVCAQCAELCEKVERLGRFENWVQDRAILDLLDRQWAEVQPDADTEWRARYRGHRERFLGGYGAYRREHEAQVAAEEAMQTLRDEHHTLLEELAVCAALGEEAELANRLEQLSYRWDALERLPQKERAALDHRYFDLLDAAARARDELIAQGMRNTHMRGLVDRGERALGQTAPLERKPIRSLIEDALALCGFPGADRQLAEAFEGVRARLEARLTDQMAHAEQRLAELPQTLDRLSAALDDGELRQAESLSQSAGTGLELAKASGLSRKACDQAAERLRTLAPRLHELQTWRKWGSDRQREELCLAMEELNQADMPLEDLALQLHDLQMKWKAVDKGGSRPNHPMWDRFHAISQQVYERCRPYLEAQATEREANRHHRENLCRQLEDFLDKVDWEHMDWKKAFRAEQEMRQAWAACGEVEGRHRKALEKRFHTAIRHLDRHLGEERKRNQQHKQELIDRVETLVVEPDLDQAIEETKRLQRRWNTTVPARKKEENKLWRRFRAGCDAVFARRREHLEAQRGELEHNLRQLEAICDQAEQLAASSAEPEEIKQALRELDLRWRDSATLPVPRQMAGKLDQRWREVRDRVSNRHRERLYDRQQEDMDLLARQAKLCERLERALEEKTGSSTETEALQTQWQTLPKQRNAALQSAIEQRFRTASDALASAEPPGDHLARSLAANAERRAEICLHLEILAQIDSPSELAQERLEFQVNRLKDHMREGEKDPLEGASRLIQEWYLCGSAPAPEAPTLESRFQRARTALSGTHRENEAA